MSRSDWDNARLRRLRRVAARHNLSILMNAKPDARRKHDGPGYMISNEDNRTPIMGHQPIPYGATLEEVEAYFEKLGEEE